MISNLKSKEENSEYLKSVIGVYGRNYIDWKNSIGCKIEYEYKGSKGVLKIVKYEPKNQKVYFEGYEKGIRTGDLQKCKLGGVFIKTIWDKARWMVDLGISEEDAKSHTLGSHKKVEVKCPDCGRIKKIAIYSIYQYHSICCSCGDGVSYPEKLMESLLIQLDIKYERQYKTDWSENRIYDFYLPDYNIIIETHGIQHYKESNTFTRKTLKEEQENDKFKKELALKNGIEHYIVIDCSKSELEYIKNNILNSRLNELFENKVVDWNKCEEYALKNKVKEVCDYYKKHQGISTDDLAKEFNMHRVTVTRYLKQGTKMNWCKYDAKEEMKLSGKLRGKLNGKAVSQFTFEGEFIKTYPSVMEAERETGMSNSSIDKCCNGKLKKAGGYIWKWAE